MNNAALADNVRGWVHYDNLASSLQKQVVNARNERDKYENNVHQQLKNQQMLNAVIQISGAQLQLQEDKVTSGLTIKALQDSIHSFFRGHPELANPDKLTKELLEHIKQQRTTHTNLRLKKLKAPPAQGSIQPPV